MNPIFVLAKILLEASPYIVAGFLMAGAIHQWIPQNILMKHLGRAGGWPLLKAVGIGSLLPMCSCGTIPLGVGLHKCGAARGTVLSFMTSSPVLSPVVVLIALKLLGGSLTFMLLGSALVGSFLIGWVGNRILGNRNQANNGTDKQYENVPKKFSNPIKQWLHWSFFELGAHVSVELIMGLSIATLVFVWLPVDLVASYLGSQSLLSLVLVILLGIPVYACSVPSVPIVHSLLLMGASPGTAIAYMIAGPATNLGELNSIRVNMGFRTAAYYVVALIVVALIAGTVADQFVFSDYEYQAAFINGKLIVEQCCVPILFEDTTKYLVDFSQVSPLEWLTGTVLLVVIGVGVIHEIREFFVNPCKSCIWKDYQKQNRCAARCHVRRKHDWIRKLKS